MAESTDDAWLDGDAGRLVRPYAVANGRTTPSVWLDLMTMVVATRGGRTGALEFDHVYVLEMCEYPTSVAEIAARVRLPAVVTKVLLSDLVDCGAVQTAAPQAEDDSTNRILLERLLDGLQRRL